MPLVCSRNQRGPLIVLGRLQKQPWQYTASSTPRPGRPVRLAPTAGAGALPQPAQHDAQPRATKRRTGQNPVEGTVPHAQGIGVRVEVVRVCPVSTWNFPSGAGAAADNPAGRHGSGPAMPRTDAPHRRGRSGHRTCELRLHSFTPGHRTHPMREDRQPHPRSAQTFCKPWSASTLFHSRCYGTGRVREEPEPGSGKQASHPFPGGWLHADRCVRNRGWSPSPAPGSLPVQPRCPPCGRPIPYLSTVNSVVSNVPDVTAVEFR